MLEEGRRRVAKAEAQKSIQVTARKEKLRRHKRRREAAGRVVSEEERERRRAQGAAAEGLMEWLYRDDHQPAVGRRLRVAVDLLYDPTESQYSSLARQLGCAYGFIRKQAMGEATAGGAVAEEGGIGLKNPPPSYLPAVHLTSATGPVMVALGKNGGDAWRWRRDARPVFDMFPPERLVYLTPDSPNVLEVRRLAGWWIGA